MTEGKEDRNKIIDENCQNKIKDLRPVHNRPRARTATADRDRGPLLRPRIDNNM